MAQLINDFVLEAAVQGDFSLIKSVPKTDLHAHLVLSAPFDCYKKISKGRIKTPPARFKNLDDFLEFVKAEFFPILDSMQAYKEISRACFDYMIADGIVYTEVSYDTVMPLLIKVGWAEFVAAMQEEIDRVKDKLTVCPELGLARDYFLGDWQEPVREALNTGFFRSVDLYGAETLKPVSDFKNFFDLARKKAIKIKIHSGETGAADRIVSELKEVRPQAIQHGVRSAESQDALTELADAQVEVNVCPWSNYCLRVVDQYSAHPIRQMFDAGVKVTLNSDDFGVFGKGVSEEYVMLYEQKVFKASELEKIRQNGLSAREHFLKN